MNRFRERKNQSSLEYVLLFAGVVLVILYGTNGVVANKLGAQLDMAGKIMQKSANQIKDFPGVSKEEDNEGGGEVVVSVVTFPSNLDEFKVSPNLVKKGKWVWFNGLMQNTTIRVYTISGEEVFKISFGANKILTEPRWRWNLRDKKDVDLARGVYFCKAAAAGYEKIIKLVIK